MTVRTRSGLSVVAPWDDHWRSDNHLLRTDTDRQTKLSTRFVLPLQAAVDRQTDRQTDYIVYNIKIMYQRRNPGDQPSSRHWWMARPHGRLRWQLRPDLPHHHRWFWWLRRKLYKFRISICTHSADRQTDRQLNISLTSIDRQTTTEYTININRQTTVYIINIKLRTTFRRLVVVVGTERNWCGQEGEIIAAVVVPRVIVVVLVVVITSIVAVVVVVLVLTDDYHLILILTIVTSYTKFTISILQYHSFLVRVL